MMTRKFAGFMLGFLAGLALLTASALGQASPPRSHSLTFTYATDRVGTTQALAQVAKAKSIVIGTVLVAEPAQAGLTTAGDRAMYTDWRVRVDRALRDAPVGQTITVRTLGGSGAAGTMRFAPQATLLPGDQVLLFLDAGHFYLPDTPISVYSIVGEGLGVYRVQGDRVQRVLDAAQTKALDQVIREIAQP